MLLFNSGYFHKYQPSVVDLSRTNISNISNLFIQTEKIFPFNFFLFKLFVMTPPVNVDIFFLRKISSIMSVRCCRGTLGRTGAETSLT